MNFIPIFAQVCNLHFQNIDILVYKNMFSRMALHSQSSNCQKTCISIHHGPLLLDRWCLGDWVSCWQGGSTAPWHQKVISSLHNILYAGCMLVIRHFTPSGEHLVTSKLMQNPVILHHDFVVGPLVSWPGLAAALQRRAAWCWEHRCNNTVYNTLHSTGDTGDKPILAFADNTFKLDHFWGESCEVIQLSLDVESVHLSSWVAVSLPRLRVFCCLILPPR